MAEPIYGLLGEHLGHSFSVQIHQKLGTPGYQLIELPEHELADFLRREEIRGLNVTIPYKRSVMPYCDVISAEAAEIGCVNTVVRERDGLLHAYNTDKYGFEYMIRRANLSLAGKKVLILGDGGASLSARAAVRGLGAREVVVMCRRGPVTFDQAASYADSEIIVNTTPVGMYPNNLAALVDLEDFPQLCGMIDVIYNPRRTALLLQARELGLPNTDGLPMLVAQAKAAEELFYGQPLPDGLTEATLRGLRLSQENIVLVGMPGCGKTSVGRELARISGKRFVDTDEEIVKRAGRCIPEIFADQGEDFFRKLEAEETKKAGQETGLVVACGGGVVLNPANYPPLKQNGRIYHLTRPLALLAIAGRPLSADQAALEKMAEQRLPLYARFRDAEIPDRGTIQDIARHIWREFHENIDN